MHQRLKRRYCPVQRDLGEKIKPQQHLFPLSMTGLRDCQPAAADVPSASGICACCDGTVTAPGRSLRAVRATHSHWHPVGCPDRAGPAALPPLTCRPSPEARGLLKPRALGLGREHSPPLPAGQASPAPAPAVIHPSARGREPRRRPARGPGKPAAPPDGCAQGRGAVCPLTLPVLGGDAACAAVLGQALLQIRQDLRGAHTAGSSG